MCLLSKKSFEIFLSILIITFLASSCKSPSKKIIGRFSDGTPIMIYEYPDHSDTSSFISITYYPNGRVHQRDTVKNFKVVGRPTVYYSNGNVYQIDSFFSSPDAFTNQWNGVMTQFYENGKISGQFSIKNGIIDGRSKHFNIDGILIKEYFEKDSVKQGDYKEFYNNGKVSFQATFLNDVPVGYEYFFDENGDTVKYFAVNKNGESSLPYKKWLKNGEILQGDFADSTKNNVTWVWFSRDGKELRRKTERSTNKMFVVHETD